MTKRQDIQSFIPLRKVVNRAIADMYGDHNKDEARFTMWAVDGLKKLTRETLRSGKRYAVLNINKHLNSAVLPCDFNEEIYVGLIDSCGEKIDLNINNKIVNNFLIENEIPCDQPCEAKCNCYPKQMCADLQTTQVVNKAFINSVEYDQTVTTTLLPNGEYYKVTTTPILDIVTDTVVYQDKKEYIATFDTATCGCVKPTARNCAILECLCWDVYCCYCTSCKSTSEDFGGYRIFKETGTIHFDGAFVYDKAYLEYRGSMPKSGNEFLVPEVAYDTLRELTKSYSIQNKKGVPKWERDDQFEHYVRERSNMKKVLGRISLADILRSALMVPKFDFNANGCYTPASAFRSSTGTSLPTQVLVQETVYVSVPVPAPPTIQYPPLITFEGTEAAGGTTYSSSYLNNANKIRIFSSPVNRMLTTAEYTWTPGTATIVLLTGPYGAGDWFDIFPIYNP